MSSKAFSSAVIAAVVSVWALPTFAGVNPGAPGSQLSQSGAKVSAKKDTQEAKAAAEKDEPAKEKKSD